MKHKKENFHIKHFLIHDQTKSENVAALEVSIGVILTFKVIFTPLENIPTIPPLSTYIINICLVLLKRKERLQYNIYFLSGIDPL